MEDLVLSCLESRVETNRNLYARFLVGPFLKGDALTVATALRRVLLSSVESIGITALYIQGITHEFSTIPGVRESVLELSLNFRAIVLCYDKTFFQKKNFFDDIQIGYLQVQGPRVVYANDLKLPLGIRLVDPTQYITTISKEGSIVLKFVIGKKNNLLRAVHTNPLYFTQQNKAKSYSSIARTTPLCQSALPCYAKQNTAHAHLACKTKQSKAFQPTPVLGKYQMSKSALLERAGSFFLTKRPSQKSKIIITKKLSFLQTQNRLQVQEQAKRNPKSHINFSIKKVEAPLLKKQSIYFTILGEQIKKNITRAKKRYSYKNSLEKNRSRTRTWFTDAITFQFSILTRTNISLIESILRNEIQKSGFHPFAPFSTFFLGQTIQGFSLKVAASTCVPRRSNYLSLFSRVNLLARKGTARGRTSALCYCPLRVTRRPFTDPLAPALTPFQGVKVKGHKGRAGLAKAKLTSKRIRLSSALAKPLWVRECTARAKKSVRMARHARNKFCFIEPRKKDKKYLALLQRYMTFPFCYNSKIASTFAAKKDFPFNFVMQNFKAPSLKKRKFSKYSPLISNYWSCKQKQFFLDRVNLVSHTGNYLPLFAPSCRAHSCPKGIRQEGVPYEASNRGKYGHGKGSTTRQGQGLTFVRKTKPFDLVSKKQSFKILLRKTLSGCIALQCADLSSSSLVFGKDFVEKTKADKVKQGNDNERNGSKVKRVGVSLFPSLIGVAVQRKSTKTSFRAMGTQTNLRWPRKQMSIFKERSEDGEKRSARDEITRYANTVKTKFCAHNFEPPVKQPELNLLKSSKESTFFGKNKVFKSNICLRNIIPLDPSVSPVLKVNFVIEIDDEVLYLRQKIRERIILEVWTNGSIHPRQAVHNSAITLTDMFASFRSAYRVKSYFLPLFKIKQSNKISQTPKSNSLFKFPLLPKSQSF